jgi:hypothetical protein
VGLPQEGKYITWIHLQWIGAPELFDSSNRSSDHVLGVEGRKEAVSVTVSVQRKEKHQKKY